MPQVRRSSFNPAYGFAPLQTRSPSEFRRLAVLGYAGVGKSALATRFALGFYLEARADPTIEDSYRTQRIIDDKIALFEILDTGGLDELQSLREQYIRTNEGFLLVYSITSRYSFEKINALHRQVLRIRGQDFSPVIIVAAKCDLEHKREVTMEEGSRLAKYLGCRFFETSAKDNFNVDRPFNDLVRELRVCDHKPKERHLAPKPVGGRISWILKGWTRRYDGELKDRTKDGETKGEPKGVQAALHAKDRETEAEPQDEVDRGREKIERIKRDSERMAAAFGTERSRLKFRIMKLENENHRHVKELEGLREELVRARKEVKTLRIEHKQRETELLDEKKQAEERKIRQLEEERNARELAEAQYQEDLRALQQRILRVEAEKKCDAIVLIERIQAHALDIELQRQVTAKEEEQARY